MMSSGRRRLLDSHLVDFARDIEVEEVLLHLQARGTLTEDACEAVRSAGSARQQRVQLIRVVQRRGEAAFDSLYVCLVLARQPHLAALIREAVREDVRDSIENSHPSSSLPSSLPSVSGPCCRTRAALARERHSHEVQAMQSLTIAEPWSPSSIRVEMVDGGEGEAAQAAMGTRNDVYDNFSSPKGLALIINNRLFDGMPDRPGTDRDRDALQILFSQLGYKVQVENDLTAKDMMYRIESFARDPCHRRAHSAILAVLTHGEHDCLLGVDSNGLGVASILEMLNARRAPALANKPKLLFLQACRGDRKDIGHSVDSEDGTAATCEDGPFKMFSCVQPQEPEVPQQRIPIESDFVIAYATVPRYVSWRNSLNGTWFVQSICEIFSKRARTDDLLTLLTEVNRRVSEDYETGGKWRQQPEFHTRLRKKFYFFPGVTR